MANKNLLADFGMFYGL